jgi:hypothetical protein
LTAAGRIFEEEIEQRNPIQGYPCPTLPIFNRSIKWIGNRALMYTIQDGSSKSNSDTFSHGDV